MKKVLLSALALVALASCKKTDDHQTISDGTVSITSGITSRASETTWHKGDKIGVFMVDGSASAENNNALYTNSNEDGASAAFGSLSPLKYPETGTVDFLAYYPYSATTTETTYSVDVSNQSNLSAIDLMVSSLSDVAVNTSPVNMTFTHRLSNIVITLTEGRGFEEGVTPFDDNFEVALVGTNATAVYNLSADEITNLASPTTLSLNRNGLVHQGIVVPQVTTSVKVVITHPVYGVFESVITGVEFQAGKKHQYTAKVNASDGSIQIIGATITNWIDVDNEDITADLAKTPFTTSVNDANAMVHYITSADDLRLLATKVNDAVTVSYAGVLFVVTDNIELGGTQFTAIGTKTGTKPFSGVFDGNNKTISGLSANGSTFQGLFGYTLDATIKNLTLDGTVTGTGGNVGGIVCVAENSLVTNCHNKANVSGGGFAVGGVVANNNGSVIENCVNSGSITGQTNATAVGGVTGNNTGSLNKSFSVLNCYNVGSIAGIKSQIGGVGGNAGANGNFSGNFVNCYNAGTVTVDVATINFAAVVGNVASDKARVNNCYYDSEVTPTLNGALVPKDSSAEPVVTEEKATAKTTEEMKDAAFITELNSEVWAADTDNKNSGYPILTTIKY